MLVLAELLDDKDHKFERDKELAKQQVKATFSASIGSVFAVLGITLLAFGLTATLESVSKSGEQITLYQIVGNVYSITGLFMLIFGLAMLVIGGITIPRKIDGLK